ncbi:glycosylphosphatidylinositol anchored membrane protein boudin [Cochliomyia hominivorax]
MCQKLLLQCILLSAALSSVMAINCYVCDASDTNSPFQCGEWFERFDEPDLEPQNCSNVHDAKYCIKHVGRFEGGIGAKRFCSSKDLGNYCDYVRNKGDRMDYRSCIYTCNTDGCNAASNIQLTQLLLPAVVGVVVLVTAMRWKNLC